MSNRNNVLWTALIALAFTAPALHAQDRDRGRDRDPAAGQERAEDRDRIQDRDPDRVADRDRVQERDRDQVTERDSLEAQDRDRDRDRTEARGAEQLHTQDRAQFRSSDIYGAELMSEQERREYRERLEAIDDDQEWVRFRAEHQARIEQRAQDRGVELPAPVYGQALMTDQEREQLRARLANAETEQEREQILAQSHAQMQDRARQHDIQLSELE